MSKEKELVRASWQSKIWWSKNWFKVIIFLGMVLGIILTFVGHTSGIADLKVRMENIATNMEESFEDIEEEGRSLKDLVSIINMKVGILSSDVGRTRENVERLENVIIMGRDE